MAIAFPKHPISCLDALLIVIQIESTMLCSGPRIIVRLVESKFVNYCIEFNLHKHYAVMKITIFNTMNGNFTVSI